MTKNIIVSGSSRGIGRAVVSALLEQGHRVWALTGNPSALEELQKYHPDKLSVLAFDFLNPNSRPDLIGRLQQAGIKIDALVNNAGWLKFGAITELTEEDWRRSYEINVFGPAWLTRDLLPYFNAGAHVLNISSMGGFQGSSKFAGLSAYSSSKAALSNLTELLAEEFAENGPKVNCLALGAVQTEMLAQAFPGYEAPLSAEEMGAYIADFALNGHRFYNGKILPVSVSTP